MMKFFQTDCTAWYLGGKQILSRLLPCSGISFKRQGKNLFSPVIPCSAKTKTIFFFEKICLCGMKKKISKNFDLSLLDLDNLAM